MHEHRHKIVDGIFGAYINEFKSKYHGLLYLLILEMKATCFIFSSRKFSADLENYQQMAFTDLSMLSDSALYSNSS